MKFYRSLIFRISIIDPVTLILGGLILLMLLSIVFDNPATGF